MNSSKHALSWLIVSGLAISSNTSGSIVSSMSQESPEQRTQFELLKYIQKQHQTSKSMSGAFTQEKQLHNFDYPIKSSGRFSISTSQSLQWDVLKPVESSIRLDSEGVELSNNRGGLSSQQRPEAATIAKVVRALLSMDWHLLEKYFAILVVTPDKPWTLLLTPKDTLISKLITQVAVSGDNTIEQVVITDQRGDITRISLTVDPR